MTVIDDSVAAIVVAYLPAPTQIRKLVTVLAQECKVVYVMDNGGGCDAVADIAKNFPEIRVIDMNGNQGIGAALNLGFRLAISAAVKYVATFDQDSEPPLGQTTMLARAFMQLSLDNAKIAAVGPRIVDQRHQRQFEYAFMLRRWGWPTALHCSAESKYIEADFLITSGCVIPLSAFEIVGPFDQSLFIDCTDMEWCFRARALGFRLFGVCTITMPHELGTGAFATALGITILGHGHLRRYYYARNTIRLSKLPHVALGWKARMLLGLFARMLLLPFALRFASGWTSQWCMLWRGIADGMTGVGGVCRYDT